MKYVELLKEHNLDAATVPVKTRSKITRLVKLEQAVATEQARLPSINSKRQKEQVEADIKESMKVVEQLDEEIVEALQRYVDNKPHYDAQSARLKATTAARKEKRDQSSTSNPAPDNDPNAATTPATTPDVTMEPIVSTESTTHITLSSSNETIVDPTPTPNKKADTTPADVKTKKKSSGVGWLLGGLAFVALAAIGINYKRNN